MPTITCLICPNGCGLSVKKEESIFLVKGNRCPRGVDYAKNHLKKAGLEGAFQSSVPLLHYPPSKLAGILENWDLSLTSVDGGSFIQGSPERSLFRTGIFCGKRRLILEQIESNRTIRREKTAERLKRMARNGLPVSPFLPGNDGKAIQNVDGNFWMLTPFIEGRPLNRLTYWQDTWRGKAVGEFLNMLYSQESPDPDEPAFDLPSFICDLVIKIQRSQPELYESLKPILARLQERFFPVYDQIPLVFSHGDAHPLNIIWGEFEIKAVIDWEFSGSKSLLYDSALIMGCVGSEDPEAFSGPFNTAFYKTVAPLLYEPWGSLLPDFILALRFAWLNEWLRHEDGEMLAQETQYMEMLL
ncbi:MAG: phosphotransferase [Spirochaetales bacterium]|nr:phosphotransferase [Spirochaetales bacterium]